MPRHPERPKSCNEINSYSGLRWYARAWIRRKIGNLILVGNAGTGKSEIMKEAAGQGLLLLQGKQRPVHAYQKLYQFVQGSPLGPVLFDDADSMFQGLSGQNMMKEVLIDKPDRLVTWGTDYSKLAQADIPDEFLMSNPVCVILNRWRTFNEHLDAVKNRGNLLYFNPTAEEVHEYVARWFLQSREAQMVHEFTGRYLPLIRTPSIREFYEEPLKQLRAEWELGEPNPEGGWQRMVLKKLLKGRALEAALLHADPSFASNHTRAQAFRQMGLGDERTYCRWIQRLNLGIPGESLGPDSTPNCQMNTCPSDTLAVNPVRDASLPTPTQSSSSEG